MHQVTRPFSFALWVLGAALVLLLFLSKVPDLCQALYLNVAMVHTTSWAAGNHVDPQYDLMVAEHALAAWEEITGGETTIAPRHVQYGPYLQAYIRRAERWEDGESIRRLYDAGKQSLAVGDYSQAVALFRTVLEGDPYEVEAYIYLLRALQAMGDTAAAQEVETDLLSLAPPLRLGEQTPEPAWQEVERVQVWPGWYLLGFDVRNAWEIAYVPTLEMVFYWQRTDSYPTNGQLTISDEGNWQEVALEDRVWQIGPLPNLAPNPGFEQTIGQSLGRPTGWPREKYTTSVEQVIDQVWTDRAGEPTLVLRLNNLTGFSGVVSRLVPAANSDMVYLQAAWLRAEPNARPCLGRQWYPDPGHGGKSYSYTVCNTPLPEGWTHVASIAPQYDGGVTEVELWMLNIGRGAAFFDDLLFVPLHKPVFAVSD